MIGIDWVTVGYVVALGALAGWVWYSRRNSLKKWMHDLSAAVRGSQTDAQTLVGERHGLRFEIRYSAGVNDRPQWLVRFPGIQGPSFAIRVETKTDRFFKRLGFVKESRLEDPELDERLLIVSNDPEGVATWLRAPALVEPLAKIWPKLERPQEGSVVWIQAGAGLSALIDVSTVSEASFDERIATLLDRVAEVAAAVHQAPAPALRGDRLRPEVLDTSTEFAVVSVSAAVLVPAVMVASSLVKAWTHMSSGLHGWWLLGALAVGTVVGLLRLFLARGRPAFHRVVWQWPAIALLGVSAGYLVPALLNLVREDPPQSATVKVTGSWEEEAGIFKVWEVELDGLGSVLMPYDEGAALEKDQQVDVVWTRGLLGDHRVLRLAPAQSEASAAAQGP